MLSLAIFKRVVPFLITFAAGLFVASFFVSLAAPNFTGFRRGSHKMREYRKVKMEAEQLRRENRRLKRELEELRSERSVTIEKTEPLAEVDVFAVPPPPLPVTKHKEMKMRSVEIK